ncbi:hypothetical protein TeGR_g15054 [Tetraparma gracilis]|uniref:Uncharacterized protein n=1 Tax=Tetraparma gracilis TaxID=2962635 RepID=A0ABQ6MYQ5_9STRA|nr:hypothetical protein TeGR_g15054 [Tetraparma gracilis]
MNEWRSRSPSALANARCLTCHYVYDVRRSKLAIALCDPRLHLAAALLCLLAAGCLLGAASQLLGEQAGLDPAAAFSRAAGLETTRWWLAGAFRALLGRRARVALLGVFEVAALFYVPHLLGDLNTLVLVAQDGDQKHLGVFLLWLASLAQNSMFAIRLALVGGTVMAWRHGNKRAFEELTRFANNACSRILNVGD